MQAELELLKQVNLTELLETQRVLQAQYAALEQTVVIANKNVNMFFTIINAVVVFNFQLGFAFLEAGSVRSKNVVNILIKNILDSCFAGIAYWAFGWAFFSGKDAGSFIGRSEFFLVSASGQELSRWFFHYVYAATASTIVSGAVAERVEFKAYLAYCLALTGWIFPVVEHWVWSPKGWLNINGFIDFAGSGVVHMLGGVASFVGAVIIGPRIGKYNKDGSVNNIPGHSVPLAALGGFILMFGFFCFNGGSVQGIVTDGDGYAASLSMVNTIIAGSTAGAVTLLAVKLTQRRWSFLVTLNGILTGMVAICAGCNAVHPWCAAIIGIFAAMNFLHISMLLTRLRIDDPLDAVAVHFGGGSWGLVSVALFHETRGIFFNFYPSGVLRSSLLFLGWNLAGLAAITVWTAAHSIVLFGLFRFFGILRVSPEVEVKGVDVYKHSEPAYPSAAYGHGWGKPWRSVANFKTNAKGELDGDPFHNLSDRYETGSQETPEFDGLHQRKPVFQAASEPLITGGKGSYGTIGDA